MKFGFIARFLFCTRHFNSYQGCWFLLHSARLLIQTGLYKGVIAGKMNLLSFLKSFETKFCLTRCYAFTISLEYLVLSPENCCWANLLSPIPSAVLFLSFLRCYIFHFYAHLLNTSLKMHTSAQTADSKISNLTENREFLSQLFGHLKLI